MALPRLYFTGRRRLLERADGRRWQLFEGDELGLLVLPTREGGVASGRPARPPSLELEIRLHGPGGGVAFSVATSLDAGPFQQVPGDGAGDRAYLAPALPLPPTGYGEGRAPEAQGGGFRLPGERGRWELEIRWGAGELTQRMPFEVARHPRSAEVGEGWARILEAAGPGASRAALVAACLAESEDPALALDLLMEQLRRRLGPVESSPEDVVTFGSAVQRLAVTLGSPSEEARVLTFLHEALRHRPAPAGEEAPGGASETGRGLDPQALAGRHLAAAFDLDRRHDLRGRLAHEYYNLAVFLWRSHGRRIEALEAARRARTLAIQTDQQDKRVGAVALELEILLELGHAWAADQAIAELEGCGADALGDRYSENRPVALSNHAWLLLRFVELGSSTTARHAALLARAAQMSREAIELYAGAHRRTDDLLSEWLNLACIFMAVGDARARQALAEAEAVAPPETWAGEDHPALGHRIRAWLSASEGDWEAARRHQEAACAVYRPLGWPLSEAQASHGLGCLLAAAGDGAGARRAFDEALLLLCRGEHARSPVYGPPLLASCRGWELACLDARLGGGREEEALAFSQRWLETRWGLLRRPAQAPGGALAPASGDRAGAEFAQLLGMATLSALHERDLAERRLGAPWGEGDPRLIDPLPPGALGSEPALCVHAYTDHLVRFVVDGGRLVRVERDPQDVRALTQDILTFSAGCQRGIRDAALADQLGRALLGSLYAAPPPRLALVCDGLPGELPFGALGTASGPLIAATELIHRPFLHWEAGPGELRPQRILILADPSRDSRPSRLEGKAIHSGLPGAELRGFHGPMSREQLLEALPALSHLHFVGHHAHEGGGSQMESHLKLGGPERLDILDMRGVRLGGAPSVILNACASGEVRPAGGWTASLANAFLAAGARCVVSTRWAIRGELARQFMGALYERWSPLADAPALSAALAGLQREAASGQLGEALADPAIWASYYLAGASGRKSQKIDPAALRSAGLTLNNT